MPEATAALPRVLVVDDDPDMTRLLRAIIAAEGYAAHHVATGQAALEAAGGADIVLLDHHLPDMRGLDVLEAIRARADAPSVVLVTAHGDVGVVAEALRRGADDFLAKDPALGELLPQVLERVRRLRALRAALAAAERELVRTERLAAIGEMTITLHHEVNNPLMAALTEVDLLLHDAGLAPAQRTGLGHVREALGRIRDIVNRSRELRQAPTTEYAPGLRMIDLAQVPGGGPGGAPGAVGAGGAPTRGSAVVYVPEPDLGRVTSLLLRHAGFRVQRVDGLDDLRRWAEAVGVSLVVVAGGSAAAGGDPLGGFRPRAPRHYTLVALAADDGAAARAAGADHVVTLPFDPATLGAEVLGAMARPA
ncbi:MAG TPA: response regulator [Gemmatimonadales bacterium]|nr:response regulator [Gemmatimonadales bacterium]